MREVGARLGADELHEWIAYERIEPSPLAYLHAQLEALAAIAGSFSGKRFGAEDFLPALKRRRLHEAQSAAQGNAVMQMIRARMLAAGKGQ